MRSRNALKPLKPCPFCGSPAKETDRINSNVVACTGCAARVTQSEPGMGDADIRWNQRQQCFSPAPAWQAFDYNAPPESGLYWVAGTRPVWDVCASDDGRPVGVHAGEHEQFVALVWFQIWTDDDGSQVLDFAAVDPYNLGKFADEDTVSHFMPHANPAHPAVVSPTKELT